MKIPVGIREVNLCQYPGCHKEGVPCHSASDDEESSNFYCFDHCQELGFRYSCGLFLGAGEFFDFGNGLSVNCGKELEAEFWADEEDFDRRTPEERNDHEGILEYYRGEIPREVCHCDPFPEKLELNSHVMARKDQVDRGCLGPQFLHGRPPFRFLYWFDTCLILS